MLAGLTESGPGCTCTNLNEIQSLAHIYSATGLKWSLGSGSHRRHPALQAGALLKSELPREKVVYQCLAHEVFAGILEIGSGGGSRAHRG